MTDAPSYTPYIYYIVFVFFGIWGGDLGASVQQE